MLAWDPPRRLTLYRHPGMDEHLGQEVEVTFTRNDSGTRVDLEHRDWTQLGAHADAHRNGYNQGWESVFVQAFASACDAVAEIR